MNATYSGWRGSIMVALNQLLCWDQYFAIGGALRHVKFNATPGTMNCAEFPASVSTAPVQAMEISLYPTYNVLSKMIFSDPQMRKDIMCIGGTSQWPATIFRGTDQWGDPFGYLLVDPIGGQSAHLRRLTAFPRVDSRAPPSASCPISSIPNRPFRSSFSIAKRYLIPVEPGSIGAVYRLSPVSFRMARSRLRMTPFPLAMPSQPLPA